MSHGLFLRERKAPKCCVGDIMKPHISTRLLQLFPLKIRNHLKAEYSKIFFSYCNSWFPNGFCPPTNFVDVDIFPLICHFTTIFVEVSKILDVMSKHLLFVLRCPPGGRRNIRRSWPSRWQSRSHRSCRCRPGRSRFKRWTFGACIYIYIYTIIYPPWN